MKYSTYPIVYIAGKITGDPNYKPKFEKAKTEIKAKIGEALIINPVEECENEGLTAWLACMAHCKGLIDMSDVIVCLPDWKSSRGACAEVEYAKHINRCVYEIKDVLEGERWKELKSF